MNAKIEVEKKDTRTANIVFAVVLGVIALSVSVLPFFYLKGAVLAG